MYGKPSINLEHEVLITEAEFLLETLFQRNVAVGRAIADGMFVRRGMKLFVEVDNETMTAKKMREKWDQYLAGLQKFDGLILLICRTRGRLRRLIRSAERVRHCIFFSTFEWLRRDITMKWIDHKLKRTDV